MVNKRKFHFHSCLPLFSIFSLIICRPYFGSMQYNENRKSLFNVIQSIVPARLSLAMKGIAFNEYLSSLRQISVSEDLRMSQGAKKMRKGRYVFVKQIQLFSAFRLIGKSEPGVILVPIKVLFIFSPNKLQK